MESLRAQAHTMWRLLMLKESRDARRVVLGTRTGTARMVFSAFLLCVSRVFVFIKDLVFLCTRDSHKCTYCMGRSYCDAIQVWTTIGRGLGKCIVAVLTHKYLSTVLLWRLVWLVILFSSLFPCPILIKPGSAWRSIFHLRTYVHSHQFTQMIH